MLKTGEAYTISCEQKQFRISCTSLLVNSDVTNLILRQLSDNFAERFTIIKDQKVQFWTSNISARLCSITLKLQRMSI